jgi:hypothetical protein
MSPAELRAEAKTLRKRARELDLEAERLEDAAVFEARRAASREAVEARAATMCRPVWRVGHERAGGPWVIAAVEHGCFYVALPPMPGQPAAPGSTRYRVRDGYPADGYSLSEDRRRVGQLDHAATLEAWRSWCTERKQGGGE